MSDFAWIGVQSSMLKRLAYHGESLTLYAEFPSGAVYAYYDVLPEDVAEVLAADPEQGESVGKAFNRHIKQKGYPYDRLTEDEADLLHQILGSTKATHEEAEDDIGAG